MNRSMYRYFLIALGILTCISLPPTTQAATAAGRVVFALGKPTAADTAGKERVLARGDEVYPGDSLSTAARERLQLSMVDGAFISVQPNSTYVIKEYVYNGKPDGTEKATYQLVKGGIRALTGIIGKDRPGAYKVNTAVATIGIRGTGHNTRICQGDCGSQPDGLYHNTWEGITYVMNNVDSRDVPTGRAVYVKDLNSKIRFLVQTPGVTASVVSSATRRTDSETRDTEPVYQQGETQQVSSRAGTLPDFFMALTPIDANYPDITGDFGYNDVYGFFNNSGQLIGALLTPTASSSSYNYYEIRTIDLTAMQNAGDPAAAQLVNDALAASASDTTLASNIALLNSNPASVAEFSADPTTGEGWGRWANGHVLTIYYDSGSETTSQVHDLSGNQSVHFIYGPEPPAMLPITGTASYDFLGGTQSTSLGGSTIGQGVTDGSISFNFTTSFGSLDMDINHNNTQYVVAATLYASTPDIIAGAGDATTAASTSYCVEGCGFSLVGSFAGTTTEGPPQFLNFGYTVDEADPFIGVASFKFDSIALATSTVIPIDGLLTIEPDFTLPGNFDAGRHIQGTGFLNSSNEFIGALVTDAYDNTRGAGTINLDAVLGGDDASAVAEVQSLYNGAPGASSAATAVATNPATVAEFSYDSTNGIGWGRWANGEYLSFGDSGDPAEARSFSGNQSLHFIFGQDPPDMSALTSTATYSFLGGTSSTSASGSGALGNGVTSGTIQVNFALSDANINMVVNHGVNYNVSGSLYVDTAANELYDAVPGDVTASSSSPTCSVCNVTINGGFAGPAVTGGEPKYTGIDYAIQDSADTIMGVAGFQYSGP